MRVMGCPPNAASMASRRAPSAPCSFRCSVFPPLPTQTKLTAVPLLSARAVRPTRCMCTAGSSLSSKQTTSETPSTSRPLLATLVATRIRQLLLRKRTSVFSRSFCSSSPCSARALAPRDTSASATSLHCIRVSQNTTQLPSPPCSPLAVFDPFASASAVANTWQRASRRVSCPPLNRRADCLSRDGSTWAATDLVACPCSPAACPSETIFGLRCRRLLRPSTRSAQVAEKSKVCLCGGRNLRMRLTSSSNPMSSRVSASSSTRVLTKRGSKFPSSSSCRHRPGVATTTCAPASSLAR
mmetsp:Transcript_99713/g.145760  ORF Transcript_99713/g.145760 Transcript_99713/m.145760 type:complete len:298 (-) Transcript_99713:203-1096(-)